MPSSKSSRRWLSEHFSDPYVKKAQLEGYRSRAVYKLIELQKKDKLFRPGSVVVELGAAPGGWSQYIAREVGKKGRVIALDILPMEPISGVDFILGDFTQDDIFGVLMEKTNHLRPNCVLSDMAPEMSGIEGADQARSVELAELALDFACQTLDAQGVFVVKIFQGDGFEAFLRELRRRFSSVMIRKPEASRSRSREVYLVAKNLLNKTSSGMMAGSLL